MTITQLSPRHLEIARRLLIGDRQKVIAADLSMSEEHLCRLTKSEIFQQHMQELQQRADENIFDVIEHMRSNAEKAAHVITELLADDAAPAGARLSAAREVLRHAGHGQQAGPEYQPLTFEDRIMLAEMQLESENAITRAGEYKSYG
ncbi:MAG: hypothetical protein WCQ99_08165 [Pseudomonadota bacterium]